MPRKGWQAMEVPSGWYEVIRGPRLAPHTWPIAPPYHFAQLARQPPTGQGPPVNRGARWGQCRGAESVGRRQQFAQAEQVRASRELSLSAPRQGVAQLQAPFSQCEQFVVRAQKWLAAHAGRGSVWSQSRRKEIVGSQGCERQPQQPRMFQCHRPFLTRSGEHKTLTSRRW